MTRSHWPALAGGILGLAALAAMPVMPALAATYDAVAGFSGTDNPNGVWSYRQGNGNLLTAQATIDSLSYWTNGNGFNTASFVVGNPTGTEQYNGTVIYRPHELTLDGQTVGADVRFTAASAGTYTVSGLFEPNDTGSQDHAVNISENGAVTPLFAGSTSASPTFDFDVTLNAGDYLDFLSAGFGGGSYGSTGLKATLTTGTAVPEPASLAVLGFSLLGLGLIRGRKLDTP